MRSLCGSALLITRELSGAIWVGSDICHRYVRQLDLSRSVRPHRPHAYIARALRKAVHTHIEDSFLAHRTQVLALCVVERTAE
jgi:hypothetical protein